MSSLSRRIAALAASLTTALLTACGGGGGGDGDSATQLSYDTDRIQVTAFNGQMADSNAFTESSVTFNVTATNPPEGDTFILVQDSASGFGGRAAEILQLSATQFQVTLYPQTMLEPGVYQGELTVVLCKNEACSSHYAVENASLPYEVTITPQLKADIVVDGDSLASLSSDIGNDSVGMESSSDSITVEFTSNIPSSVHYSSGLDMLKVEIDPSSTDTHWVLRLSKPTGVVASGLQISLWPEDSSKFIQHSISLDVSLLAPAQ